ncbi:surface protein [Histomonas meleagridis]|uniref:surface protein n=1 Tax=Histomonas meleagridis TaxID=135588 RepID=UPI003559481F|nr:surface protein [Histomonas meleagridis]KAH0802152.1 surface protein [Histomonas meleagridis]
MSEDEFNETCEFIIEAGGSPGENGNIKSEDDELQRALQESMRDFNSQPPSPLPSNNEDEDFKRALQESMNDVQNKPQWGSSFSPKPSFESSNEDEDLKRALQESMKDAPPKPQPSPSNTDNEDIDHKRSLQESMNDSPSKPQPLPLPQRLQFPPRTESIPAEDDEDLQRAIQSSLQETTYQPGAPAPTYEFPQRQTSTQRIHNEQDREYELAMEQAKRREQEDAVKLLEEESNKEFQAEIQRAEKDSIDEIYAQLVNAAKELPDAPNGIAICLKMPSGARVTRKFDAKCAGQLHTFVKGQEEMFDEEKRPLEFTINLPQGGEIIAEKTLEEQGITRRVMLNVVLE